MKDDKIFRAIGNIDDDLVERAAPKEYGHKGKEAVQVRVTPWLKWFVPLAACVVIVIAAPILLKEPSTGSSGSYMTGADNSTEQSSSMSGGGYVTNDGNAQVSGAGEVTPGGKANEALTGSVSGNSANQSPSLSLDGEAGYAACYTAPEDWRGLPTEDYVLAQQDESGIVADRMVFMTLKDLAAYADAFVVVPNVHKTAQDSENMQTSIVEYAETIGDRLSTHQWDDRTVSTSSRILIRQWLIGGCTMDEPNNLLRKGGVYLLPVTFFPAWGAYEVVGDLDVLFELDDEGKIVSHSQWEGFNKYDGKSFDLLLDDVKALYPVLDADFIEQPIDTVEQAENQVIIAYKASGFRKFSVEYDSEAVHEGVDVFRFKIIFGYGNFEYAAIAKENGAFIRGDMKSDGDIQIWGGLGGFPW